MTDQKPNNFQICGILLSCLSILMTCEASASAGSSEFIEATETQFVLNGYPFLFNGFDSYWMMIVAAQPSQRFKVSNVFRDAAAAGLRVCRTWAFNDGGNQSLQISPGLYNEAFFQALDFVISEAKRHGIRLILTLINNYNDFGGRLQYVSWARTAGASITGVEDFYSNEVAKRLYKHNVEKVLTRNNTITGVQYRDDPTIMAWELINEPHCDVDKSGKTLNGWVEEMAAYVKTIDNKHLLSIGMEGFYGDSTPDRIKQFNPHGYEFGTDFISNHLVKGIDFATIHAYPDLWLSGQSENEQMEFMQNWITSHWNDSKNSLKKPLVFSEFGKSKKDPGYSTEGRDKFMDSVYSSIYNLSKHGGTIAGGLVWQILEEGMESFHDGYEIVLSQDRSTASVITQQSDRMIGLQHIQRSPHVSKVKRPSNRMGGFS